MFEWNDEWSIVNNGEFTLCVSYLYTGLNILILVHDWQDGLHAAVFNQVRLIPHKDQWHPSIKLIITTLSWKNEAESIQ